MPCALIRAWATIQHARVVAISQNFPQSETHSIQDFLTVFLLASYINAVILVSITNFISGLT